MLSRCPSSSRRPRARGILLLVLWLMLAAAPAHAARDDDRRGSGGYVFATTRGLGEMDAHPALRVSVLPVAIVLDLLFLPFAVVADVMSGDL